MHPVLKQSRRFLLKLEANAILRSGLIENYQPVPALGQTNADRSRSSWQRWQAIAQELGSFRGSALDVGCNLGFFTFQLADLGFISLGVESDGGLYHVCNLLKQINPSPYATFLNLSVTSELCPRLPDVDVVIFLSVLHHIVRQDGIDSATMLLRGLLAKTQHVMFFEMGQSNETNVTWAKALPDMQPNPRAWLEQYLLSVGASRVKHLGDYETHLSDTKRSLFAVYPK